MGAGPEPGKGIEFLWLSSIRSDHRYRVRCFVLDGCR